MMNVTLNVVGLYYGETLEIPEADPSVEDVLKAAEKKGLTKSGRLSYRMNTGKKNSIKWVENDLTELKNPVSRKRRPAAEQDGGCDIKLRPARKLKSKVLKLDEAVFNQPASDGSTSLVVVAWQYYIEKARTKNPPLVTTTFSIDNVIVDAGASNKATIGKKIEDGDTVTLRLLCINSSRHGSNDDSLPDSLPSPA